MSNKSLVKFGAAFVLLAAVLIFLGVNYVPRIFASSSPQRNTEFTVNQSYILHSHYHTLQYRRANLIQIRPDYLDERYPRAIVPQLSSAGSGYERHFQTDELQASFAGSGYERHFQADGLQTSSASSGYERHFQADGL